MNNKQSDIRQNPILILAMALLGTIVSVAIFLVLVSFIQVFSGFGSGLPLIAQLVIQGRWGFVFLAGLCLILGVTAMVTRSVPFARASSVFSILAVALALVVMVALYLPLLSLGQA